jgi:uncharacterized protein (DUF58 family)
MRLSSLFKYLKPPRGFRLTRAGRIFFSFLICIIVISLATGNNLLYLILAGMLAFMIVSGIESELNLRYLELDRLLPSEIHAGIPARIGYLVRNRRTASSRLLLNDRSVMKIVALPRGETLLLHADISFPRRGRETLGDIIVSTTYPYGLFEKSITFSAGTEFIVFPCPLAYAPPPSSGSQDSGGGKAQDSISHVRPYVPGDPLSSVVWKKQHLGLISRVFEGGAGMSGLVVVLPGPDMETKLSYATYTIAELHRLGRPFGLLLSGYYSGIALSREHKIRILTQLAQTEWIGQPSMEAIPQDAQIISI